MILAVALTIACAATIAGLGTVARILAREDMHGHGRPNRVQRAWWWVREWALWLTDWALYWAGRRVAPAGRPLPPEDAATAEWVHGLHHDDPWLPVPVLAYVTQRPGPVPLPPVPTLAALTAGLDAVPPLVPGPLDYAPSEPFGRWESDTFVGALPAIHASGQ